MGMSSVGTPDVMNYTAIGDTVNLASRLQGLSIGGQITISQAVYDQVADQIIAEPLGPKKVKGREEPVITYEVVDLRS